MGPVDNDLPFNARNGSAVFDVFQAFEPIHKASNFRNDRLDTLDLNGTMSGEHGVGLAKQPYIHLELKPAQVAAMQAIKAALDPNNILNPGKMFPL